MLVKYELKPLWKSATQKHSKILYSFSTNMYSSIIIGAQLVNFEWAKIRLGQRNACV